MLSRKALFYQGSACSSSPFHFSRFLLVFIFFNRQATGSGAFTKNAHEMNVRETKWKRRRKLKKSVMQSILKRWKNRQHKVKSRKRTINVTKLSPSNGTINMAMTQMTEEKIEFAWSETISYVARDDRKFTISKISRVIFTSFGWSKSRRHTRSVIICEFTIWVWHEWCNSIFPVFYSSFSFDSVPVLYFVCDTKAFRVINQIENKLI